MSDSTKYCVIFNCQDPSTTIRIERDNGDPSSQSIDLTRPGTDYRAIYGLSLDIAKGEADVLIKAGYATRYCIL